MKNKDLPIYPQSNEWINDLEKHINKPDKYGLPPFVGIGLTKREYFAGLAMQGLLSNPSQIDTTHFEWVAQHAVGYADALLKEFDKQP